VSADRKSFFPASHAPQLLVRVRGQRLKVDQQLIIKRRRIWCNPSANREINHRMRILCVLMLDTNYGRHTPGIKQPKRLCMCDNKRAKIAFRARGNLVALNFSWRRWNFYTAKARGDKLPHSCFAAAIYLFSQRAAPQQLAHLT
jgi:hypothetical protein